jgi:hypothetical protein
MKTLRSLLALSSVLVLAGQAQAAQPDPNAPPPEMGVFLTSVGLGKGGDLGGLAGADAHCQALATAVDMGHRTWRAYLSTQGDGAVNAIDRIGTGPWANAKGVIMATNLDSLKYDNSNFNYEHMLDEKGNHFASLFLPGSGFTLELLACNAGLLAAEPDQRGWCRPVLLLRNGLIFSFA